MQNFLSIKLHQETYYTTEIVYTINVSALKEFKAVISPVLSFPSLSAGSTAHGSSCWKQRHMGSPEGKGSPEGRNTCLLLPQTTGVKTGAHRRALTGSARHSTEGQ